VCCGIDGCQATYSKFSAFNTHLYRNHRDIICKSSSSNSADGNDSFECDSSGSVDFYSVFTPEEPDTLETAPLELSHTDRLKISSKFLIKLKDSRGISQAAINDVVEGVQTIFSHTVLQLKAGVEEKLRFGGVNVGEVEGLQELFSDFRNPFDGIQTPYLQQKFIAANFDYVVSLTFAVSIIIYNVTVLCMQFLRIYVSKIAFVVRCSCSIYSASLTVQIRLNIFSDSHCP
jgi:hypothetical protein